MTGIYYVLSYLFFNIFSGIKAGTLTQLEKKELLYFVLPLAFTSLSGVFFGYIDTIMLGHYVQSEFIGFYQAAFQLAASASIIISFTSARLVVISIK